MTLNFQGCCKEGADRYCAKSPTFNLAAMFTLRLLPISQSTFNAVITWSRISYVIITLSLRYLLTRAALILAQTTPYFEQRNSPIKPYKQLKSAHISMGRRFRVNTRWRHSSWPTISWEISRHFGVSMDPALILSQGDNVITKTVLTKT